MTYKARRTALAQALTAAFGPAVRLSGLHTGLHLLVQFTGTVPPDQVLAAAARQAGIRLAALSSYYMRIPRPAARHTACWDMVRWKTGSALHWLKR